MDASQSSGDAGSHNGSDFDTANPQPLVRAADIGETERSIASLQSQLDRALEAGDVSGSGSLAQQVAQFKQQLRAQRQQVAASREREKEEREWESAQLHKINAIKAVVEERRKETEAIKQRLRQHLTGQRPSSSGGGSTAGSSNTGSGTSGSAASSFFSSVFSSNSSRDNHTTGHSSHKQSASKPAAPFTASLPHSTSAAAQSPLHLDDLLQRARKSIKESQVTLEKQTLIVDSVDMNEHPSTLHAQSSDAPPLHSPSLHSIKAIRKDTVQLIQSHLSHVDDLERHLDSLDACLSFLDQPIAPAGPVVQRPATSQHNHAASTQRYIRQQQQPSGSRPMR